MAIAAPATALSLDESRGRWVLLATVLGSGMAFLDATVVSVALPTIGHDLDAGLSGLQWTINAYTLTLAALILLGGAAGDHFGRRRVFLTGVIGFASASLLCGIAPNIETLVVARALQGAAGALLTPGSLSILQATFRPEDRGRAIGAWSGLGGVAGAIGPFLGGWLVESASWRWVFLVNLPLALVVVVVTLRHVPESIDPESPPGFDLSGAAIGALALGGLTYGLVSSGERGWAQVATWFPLLVGLALFAVFLGWEDRVRRPMLPLGIFSSKLFSAVNAVTFAVYAAIGGLFFMLVLTLQVAAGFSPTLAGAALLPVTLLMLTLSERSGLLAQRIGPRLQMTVGPLLAASGALLLLRIDRDTSYVADVLPGVLLFGLGLATTVAPLTTTVLAAAPLRHAGVASGVNNAVARTGGLLIVAALPVLTGLPSDGFSNPEALLDGFHRAMLICAFLLVAGGLLSALLVQREDATADVPGEAAHPVPPCRIHCATAAPPLQVVESTSTPPGA